MNLNQITLPTVDLLKSIAFYEKLGFNLIVKAEPRYARFELPSGDSTLSLHLVEELPTGQLPTIYFETDELDEKVRQLQTKGIHFDLEPTSQSWLWREARLKDLDGNLLVLYTAGENRKNPPWRIG